MKRLIHGHNRAGTVGASPTYQSWKAMKSRCDCIKNKRYNLYGAKGISYDKKWIDFTGFLNDMGFRPPGTSLDRIDNNKNYCTINCRWSTPTIQSRNRGICKNNSTGITGVHIEGARWRATISGEKLGSFNNLFDACCARKSAENTKW